MAYSARKKLEMGTAVMKSLKDKLKTVTQKGTMHHKKASSI